MIHEISNRFLSIVTKESHIAIGTLKKWVTHSLSFLAPTIAVPDKVDTPIRLSLSTFVNSICRGVTILEEGTGKERAAILAVDIMVSVHEATACDRITHHLTIGNGIDKTKGKIIPSLGGTGKVREGFDITIRGRRGASEVLCMFAYIFSEVSEGRMVIRVIAIIPARMGTACPRRKRCAIAVSGVQGCRIWTAAAPHLER